MTQVMNWADVAQLRQGLYRFFGGAFLPPDTPRVDALLAAAGYLDDLEIEAFAYAGPWDTMLDAFEDLPPVETLSAEYIRLFASGMDGELCPPTESFYRNSAEGGGLAAAMAAVQREYGSLGLTPATASVPPDHVTTELEAMAELCSREADHWQLPDPDLVRTALRRQHAFLRRHLAAWFPAFRARVRNARALAFYETTVDAAHAFLLHDTDVIGSTLRALEDQP